MSSLFGMVSSSLIYLFTYLTLLGHFNWKYNNRKTDEWETQISDTEKTGFLWKNTVFPFCGKNRENGVDF